MAAAPTESGEPPAEALRRLVDGYQVSQAIHVAATLGIADLLEAGPRTSDDLAAASQAHPASLYRLLRALASVGVFREEDDRRFALTELGDCLRSNAPEPVAGWAVYVGRPYRWQLWADLLHSVRTGENAFLHTHGVDVWDYWAQQPEEGAIFDRAMTDGSLATNRSLLDAYDFGGFDTVVDVGGGQGAFLAALLAEHPGTQGVLFDQPQVVEAAEPVLAGGWRRRPLHGRERELLRRGAGGRRRVRPPGHPAQLGRPAGGGDPAHLPPCRGRGVTLLVLERELGSPNENREAKFADLNMLVGPGGRERTIEEYRGLLGTAGFHLRGITPSRSGIDIVEAVAA